MPGLKIICYFGNRHKESFVQAERKIRKCLACPFSEIPRYKIWLYEVALEAGTTAVHDHMPLEDMPANIQKIKERIRRLSDDMETRYRAAGSEKAEG